MDTENNKENENIVIRLFEEKDAVEVANIIIENYITINIRDYSLDYIEEHVRKTDHKFIINRASWTHFYVVEKDNKLVGCGAIGPYWDSETESSLFNIFVLPEYHNQGLGRLIIETLEQDEYYKRAERIEVPSSIYGLEFYKKFGYTHKKGFEKLDEEGIYRLEKYKTQGE